MDWIKQSFRVSRVPGKFESKVDGWVSSCGAFGVHQTNSGEFVLTHKATGLAVRTPNLRFKSEDAAKYTANKLATLLPDIDWTNDTLDIDMSANDKALIREVLGI